MSNKHYKCTGVPLKFYNTVSFFQGLILNPKNAREKFVNSFKASTTFSSSEVPEFRVRTEFKFP